MNIVNSRFDVSTLNNHDIKKVKESELKKFRDNLVELVKNGSASQNSVLEHGVWQICNEMMLSKISVDKLKNTETTNRISMDPDMDKAIKAYQANVDVAIYYHLLEEPEGPVRTKSLF